MAVVQLHARPPGHGGAAARGAVLAALDIGSTKISCLIAEVTSPERGELRILGLGHQLSRGVRCGSIVNPDEAERAIRLAVDAAERNSGRTISEVYVNVSGGRPQSCLYAATEQTQTGQVSPRDIEKVLNSASAHVNPGRRSILHLAPVQYHLDDARGVSAPLGMHGGQLSVELAAVTIEPAHLHNLSLVIERAHLTTAGFALAPYAAAKSVLAADEFSLGVTVVDMGGATTSFAIFHDGNLVFSDVVPLGGQNITNDIARGLSTTIAHAERMKTLWGSVLASQVDESDLIAVPQLGERGTDTVQKVPKSMLAGIIRPRLEEIFEMVRDRLEACGAAQYAGNLLVLTGGASQLTGAREVAAEWFNRQVRLGLPSVIPGMPDSALSGGFAVSAGLLKYALRPDAHHAFSYHKKRELNLGQSGYIRKMGRWIAESF
jgi:cell division protein FtsA